MCLHFFANAYRKVGDHATNQVSSMSFRDGTFFNYTYDEMGNYETRIHAPLDSDEYTFYNEIAQATPFRYRSYYFDTETGFYYMGGRYYDPEAGRFVGAGDVSQLDPYTVCGLNLYLYAMNNPVFIRSRSVAGVKASSVQKSGADMQRKNIVLSRSTVNQPPPTTKKGFFGYERRKSTGWEETSSMLEGVLGRIGYSSYITEVEGKEGTVYVFAGNREDWLNMSGKNYFAGYGVKLFNFAGFEWAAQTVGASVQFSLWNYNFSYGFSLIGSSAVTFSRDEVLDDAHIYTEGFTIELNTPLLFVIFGWLYQMVTTGNVSPLPAPVRS